MENGQKKILSLSLVVLLGTTSPLVLATRTALAQETQPGDACANLNWQRWASDPTPGLLVCDGANWQSVIEFQSAGRSLLQVNNDTGTCTAAKLGRLRYDGVSTWDYCDGSSWQGLLTGNGLWTDDTSHISYQSAHIIKTGQTLPAALDDDGIRMFFYPDKAAFRGGEISAANTAWQEANIGANSFAWGQNNVASGSRSVAMGLGNAASGFDSVALGDGNTASGAQSMAMGWDSTASGRTSVAIGSFHNVSGWYSTALGYNNTVSDRYATAAGLSHTVSGRGGTALGVGNTVSGDYYSTAIGSYLVVSGQRSTAIGKEVTVGSGTAGDGAGDASIGFGLQTAAQTTDPKITGDRAAVFFFDGGVADANSGFDYTSSDKLAVVGGEFVLSETQAQGAAAGCLRFEPTGNKIEYADDCATYTALSDIGGLWTDNTSHISYQSAHIIKSGQTLPAALDDNGTRMFFYPDKGAFRGGTISGGNNAWQDVNIGANSFVWGDRNEASGSNSVAMGERNTASGSWSVALGKNSTASGPYSFAMGDGPSASNDGSFAFGPYTVSSGYGAIAMGNFVDATARGSVAMGERTTAGGSRSVAMGERTTAGGSRSVALGYQAVANGSGSMAFGAQSASQATDPKVTGNRTIAFFFDGGVADANNAVDITANDAFIIHGGKVGIGADNPSVELHVVGDINYTGVIEDISDERHKVDITALSANDMLSRLEQLDTYSFRMKEEVEQYGDDARYEYGVIAQRTEHIFPELVTTADNEEKTKSVNYMGFIAPLIEAVKNLSSKNRALEEEVLALKSRTVEPEEKVPKPNRLAPESSDDPCQMGDMALDKTYFYFCTEEDMWKRSPLEEW